ncbi:MAG: hypothetical protein AAF630_02750 [Cyanobacteria bacterium P01_C01_bin.38]
MYFSQMQKTLGFLATVGIGISCLVSPAIAAGFDNVFASRVWLKRDWFGNYQLRFVPVRNSYSYQVQIAGKTNNDLACTRFAATEQDRLEWKTVRAEIGTNNSNLYAEGEIVPVYGAYIGRDYVSTSMHIRVVAIDENGNELYKTNWEGGNDIKYWGWSGDCAWVAE